MPKREQLRCANFRGGRIDLFIRIRELNTVGLFSVAKSEPRSCTAVSTLELVRREIRSF